jgi:hypothetical protein
MMAGLMDWAAAIGLTVRWTKYLGPVAVATSASCPPAVTLILGAQGTAGKGHEVARQQLTILDTW